MQVIYILSDNLNVKIFFHLSQPFMRHIGLHIADILSAHIIKIKNQYRIFFPSARGGYFLNIISFPKSVTVPAGARMALIHKVGRRLGEQAGVPLTGSRSEQMRRLGCRRLP